MSEIAYCEVNKINLQELYRLYKQRSRQSWSLTHSLAEAGYSLDLSGLDLSSMVDWSGVDFSGIDLSNCNFRGCRLTRAIFSGATLVGADFHGANLMGLTEIKNKQLRSLKFDRTLLPPILMRKLNLG